MKALFARVVAALRALNTHPVGSVGLGTGLLSIAALVLQHPIDHALAGVGIWGAVAQPLFDYYVQTLAPIALPPALAAAYLGMPGTIKSTPSTTPPQPPKGTP